MMHNTSQWSAPLQLTSQPSGDATSPIPATTFRPMSDVAKHWIDGEWVGSDTVSESINPATGETLGSWADGGEAEARAAVAAARRAFDTTPWARDPGLRHRALT